jgi:predicted nucleic acid-binding protein
LPFEFHSQDELYRVALTLTERYSLSGFDAQYVALGQALGCDVWTDDQGMLGAIAGRLRFVKWIGVYPVSDEA